MKSIKDLREQYDLVTEKEEHDMNKLTQLVRAGLFDAKKLSALKRAMEKPADKMTAQEKRMLINLLDALMSEVLSDKQVYRKIKQDVMKESKNEKKGMVAKDVTNIPAVILLKRKALRAFPDGQKIGLYYAQAIDKYVSIPFSEIGVSDVNEEISLEEGLWKRIKDFASNVASSSANSETSGTSSSKSGPKYYEPMSSKLTAPVVGAGSKRGEDSDVSPALLSWERQRYRQSLQTESYDETLSEADLDDYEEKIRSIYGSSGGIYGGVTPYGGGAFGGAGKVKPLGGGAARRTQGTEGERIGTRRSGNSVYYTRIDPKKFAADQAQKGFGTTGAVSRPVRRSPVETPMPKRDKPSGPPDRRRTKPFEDPRIPPSRPDPKRRQAPPEKKPPEKKPEQKPPQKKPEEVPAKKPDNKPDLKQGQNRQTRTQTSRGTKAKRLAAAAAGLGILGSLFSGGSENSKDREKKYTTPKSSTFKPTIADPKYSEPDAAIKSLERKLFRQSMMENVNLDGNVFELNNNTASKVKALYESLNKKNKKKMLEMMKESDESLRKVISFAVRQ